MSPNEEAFEGIAKKVETYQDMVNSFSLEFDNLCRERHGRGAEKYGPGKFLIVDTVEEALHEVVDCANYMRYTYIRLRLVQEAVMAMLPPDDSNEPVPEGLIGFIRSAEATAVKEPKK